MAGNVFLLAGNAHMELHEALTQIATLVSQVIAVAQNRIAVDGYVRAYPVVMVNNPTWDLSAQRAQVVRGLLESAGTEDARIARVSGHADRDPVTADPSAVRNNRIEVVLLRKDAEVHALPVAVGGVCGPANRSRSRTCGWPKRSTTDTAT